MLFGISFFKVKQISPPKEFHCTAPPLAIERNLEQLKETFLRITHFNLLHVEARLGCAIPDSGPLTVCPVTLKSVNHGGNLRGKREWVQAKVQVHYSLTVNVVINAV